MVSGDWGDKGDRRNSPVDPYFIPEGRLPRPRSENSGNYLSPQSNERINFTACSGVISL